MKENQKGQLIILCILIAIVVCFGAYRLVGTQTRADSEVEQETSAVMQVEAKPDGEPAPILTADYGLERSIRDPFAPQMAAPVPVPAAPATARTIASDELTMPFPLMPSFISPMHDDHDASLLEVYDPIKGFRLTGVIEGDVNLAIIRGPNDERYIVREGQRVDGKFRVKSITREGVHLIYDDQSFVLELGVRELS